MSEEFNGSANGDAGGAGSSVDWRGGLEESLRNDPSLADIRDINGLAKSYIHAQRMVGRDKIAVPQEGASPDEWNDFYNRLGRPSQYELSREGINMPEGLDYSQAMEDHMKGIFHEAGLTNAQANAIYKGYMEKMGAEFQGMNEGREAQRSEWHAQLRKDFGQAFDQQVDFAQRAARNFGGDEFLKWLDDSGMGDHPMMVKMFAKIGKSMSEGTAMPGGDTSRDFVMTPDAARQEIARLQRDSNFMKQYHSTEVDGHREAIEKMQRLFSFAYPDQGA